MPREETIEKFIYAFPKLYFFIRPHHRRKHPKVRESTRNPKNEVAINQIHFNVLWLIELLGGREEKDGYCSESNLKNVFLWRQPKDESQFHGIITALRDAGLIRTKKDDLGDGRANWLALSAEGQKMVEELRRDREETARDIFELLGLADDESAESFVDAFTEIAERAWLTLEERAKGQTKKL